jgi:nickel/cobalt transporter (NicO) family protein
MRESVVKPLAALGAVALALHAAQPAVAAESWAEQVLRPAADIWTWVIAAVSSLRNELYLQLAAALSALRAKGEAAAWSLIWLGFVYGAIRAAGPGHGKLVISTYLLTHESRLRHGLAMPLLAALLQGLIAVGLVEATVTLFDLPFRQIGEIASHLGYLSFALVAAVGLSLLLGGGRRLLARPTREPVGSAAHAPVPLSRRQMAAIVLSVGLRPGSGAVPLLLFAQALGLHAAGIATVALMSAGTALTVSALAALSVLARRLALRLVAALPEARGRLGLIADALACLGGGTVLALGASLLYDGLVAAPHPLF